MGTNETNTASYMHYVPVKETLECLFKDASALNQLQNPLPTVDGILQDYNDSLLCKMNPFIQENNQCLN